MCCPRSSLSARCSPAWTATSERAPASHLFLRRVSHAADQPRHAARAEWRDRTRAGLRGGRNVAPGTSPERNHTMRLRTVLPHAAVALGVLAGLCAPAPA